MKGDRTYLRDWKSFHETGRALPPDAFIEMMNSLTRPELEDCARWSNQHMIDELIQKLEDMREHADDVNGQNFMDDLTAFANMINLNALRGIAMGDEATRRMRSPKPSN